jgi:hypothetical protein
MHTQDITIVYTFKRNRRSVVGIETKLRTGRSGARIHVRERFFSIPRKVQTSSGVHSASKGTGFIPGVKWPACEIDRSLPTSAKAKNNCSYTSIFPYGLLASTGISTLTFTFTFILSKNTKDRNTRISNIPNYKMF